MSSRQCCVWGCHNRKGRCPEDVKDARVCECPNLLSTGCPKSGELHYIEKMPDQVKKAVVSKINKTKQTPSGGQWHKY